MKVLISATDVDAAFRDSLFREGEEVVSPVIATGITLDVGFHPGRLETHRAQVRDWLHSLPAQFVKDTEDRGGWTFLNACVDTNGRQWGEQHNVQQLLLLGLALGLAEYCLPKEMWGLLPGGMPYFSVTG